jgi:hypothetical protein
VVTPSCVCVCVWRQDLFAVNYPLFSFNVLGDLNATMLYFLHISFTTRGFFLGEFSSPGDKIKSNAIHTYYLLMLNTQYVLVL